MVSLVGGGLILILLIVLGGGKSLSRDAEVCLGAVCVVWMLAEAAYMMFLLITDGEESLWGFIRSWQIEKTEKRETGLLATSTTSDDGEQAEEQPDEALALARQNWETICAQCHDCGCDLFPYGEQQLFLRDALKEAIRVVLYTKYQARIEALSIYFIIKKGEPGFRISYIRSSVVKREQFIFPKFAGKPSDDELMVLLIQGAVERWRVIRDAFAEWGIITSSANTFSADNRVLTRDEVLKLQDENAELRKVNEELREMNKTLLEHNTKLQSEQNKLQKELDDLAADYKMLRARYDMLDTKTRTLTDTIQQLNIDFLSGSIRQ